ncbi:MAG: transcription termination factor Rho [Acidimicrobiia bacterium]
MSTETSTSDPSTLGSKDRAELTTIASALGIKGASRLKKSELVDAISGANGGTGDGAATPPKRISSKRASELAADSIDAIIAEEERLASQSDGRPDDDLIVKRAPKPKAIVIPPPDGTPTDAPARDRSTSTAPEAVSADNGTERSNRGTGDRPRRNENRGRNDNRTDNRNGARNDENSANDFDDMGNRSRNNRGRNNRGRNNRGRDRETGGYDAQVDFQGEPVPVAGLLDLRDEGYGFLRCSGYLPGRHDVYVPAPLVRKFGLRRGDSIRGASRPQTSTEKFPALLRVDEVNGMDPEVARGRVRFEDLTPLFPDSRLRLEMTDDPQNLTGRIVDLVAPIGKGQRGLIVSPPKAGKTTIMKHIVSSVEQNNPEVHLMVLLVDERPEEVTDMRRHVQRGEVIASTFDRPADEHTHVSELTIERAKRLVELGKDVVIVLDGITRLARAYNLAAPASGRIMSGGVDSSALYPPKRFFGAARNVEEGGSLTILATALIETGSKMDEVIFEEFKGTGNMELRLDRRTADRRIFPAIDVESSGTRHEELLYDRVQLNLVWKLRRVLLALDGAAGLELLIDKIRTTKSNDEFLADIAKAP